jgi:dipeptidyl aminopeptidase/acylaminoacyl peptidase
MRLSTLALILCVVSTRPSVAQTASNPDTKTHAAEKPAALVADGVPDIPREFVSRTRPYLEYRTATFLGWQPTDRSMLIATRFGNTSQVHRVARPDGARVQLSFEEDPLAGASPAPRKGDVIVVQKDAGGDEFFQLYRLESGRLELLTDGRSRNEFGAWSQDGTLVGYSSTRRNGTDTDLYIVDPRDAKTDRRVAGCKGGGWNFTDFSADGAHAVVREYISITHSNLWLLDLASGALTAVGDHSKPVAYGGAQFAPDGTLWVTTDQGSEFLRLGTMDVKSGKFMPRNPDPRWDVERFDLSDDGRFVAYVLNDAGRSTLRLLDVASGNVRTAPLPAGTLSSLEVAPWGDIGLTLASARSPADAFSVNPGTLAVTRWTVSETGGLDASLNVEPELVETRSFDGLPISGFLYRPEAKKFPGRRPVIVNIHGGPESQSRPGFLGRNNYLINELGIALFYPNVRGSAGYGKSFVSLDNGPFKREDSVRDIGTFLDVLAADPRLDPKHVGVTGGSYGGYMCYASAIFFSDRLQGATCVVAISSFVTFLENTQGYRRDLRRVEYGDERDARQRARLGAISPLNRASEIRVPIFVVTGANDPRVPASEADQIIAAIRSNGGTAWHLLARDEGHGFDRKANQDYQFWSSLLFWRETLLRE